MMYDELTLFALSESREWAQRVATCLGISLSEHEERSFEDGEHKSRPLVSVRDQDVYVIQSLHGDARLSVNDKLCRLLFFLGALRDAAAGRVTAIVPYLCYARKDRKTKSRDPVTSRYVAQLFEAVDVDRVATLDVHNLAAFQNSFRTQTEHLDSANLFVRHFAASLGHEEAVVISPDVGGIKRARLFQEALGRVLGRPLQGGFMDKQRSGGVVSGEALVGDVRNRTVILLDDLISSGGTLARAAAACQARGATRVIAAATHGLFAQDAEQNLSTPALAQIVVTNSVTSSGLSAAFRARKLVELDAAPLFAHAIHRLHTGDSLVELLQN